MNTDKLTHKQAVRRIGNWLKNTKACPVVISELATANHETPDVIAFHGAGGSILVECKVSRSDFLADRNKSFRRDPESGMGDVRYFATPPGVIRTEDDLEDWGLLEIHERCVKVAREPQHQAANKRAEVKLLMSSIRRLQIATAVYVVSEPCATVGDVEGEVLTTEVRAALASTEGHEKL